MRLKLPCVSCFDPFALRKSKFRAELFVFKNAGLNFGVFFCFLTIMSTTWPGFCRTP